MNVSGSIISAVGGDLVANGDLLNPKSSFIGIYGATLTATSLDNQAGNTLIFGANNGIMGQFNGNLNNGGTVIIDLAGAKAGTHTLVNGAITSSIANISLHNGNTDFASASLGGTSSQWNGTVIMNMDYDAINNFKATLDSNQKAILGALGEGIYTLSGASSKTIASDVNHLNNALFSQFFAMPFTALDILKNNLGTHSSSLSLITQDSSGSFSTDVGVIANGILGGASGKFGGIKAGVYYRLGNTVLSVQSAYVYGSMQSMQRNYTLLQSSFHNQSHNFGLNTNLHTTFLPNTALELDIMLGYFASLTDSKREMQTNGSANQTLKANYGFHQLSLDAQLGYRFLLGGERLSFSLKPYGKIIQSYNRLSDFRESALGELVNFSQILHSPQYNAYYLSMVAGLEGVYSIDSGKHLLLGFGYEQFMLSSQKFNLVFQNGERISFNSPYNSRIGLNLSGSFAIRSNMRIGFDGHFKAAINHAENLYYYGANALFGYVF
ncbi:hypothetical protein CQA44_11485 [Helicobacter sp. MIT 14-3879]|nr:hypothetical protein CQA44_11485 [Helicobacter sp. MIT 14-3879]